MTLLLSGSIHYEVSFPISDTTFDRMEAVGRRRLDENSKDILRHLAFGHVERTEMARPKVADFRKVLDRLIRLTIKGNANAVVAYLSEMSGLRENERPAEEYVYRTLLSELHVTFEPAWRESLLTRGTDLRDMEKQLRIIRERLKTAYRGFRGGSRQNELGHVLRELARIYLSVGGDVTVSSHMDRNGNWVEETNFIRFAKVFIDALPRLPGVSRVDVGGLARRNVRWLFDQ